MRSPRWIERLLLVGFEPTEVEDITSDLRELAAGRGPVLGRLYYWTRLLGYPLRRALDSARHGSRDSTNDEGRNGMESLLKDGRYALRSLTRSPGFALMTTAIMTLSMGASIAIFSVVDGVLLEPLPVDEPDRLVSLWLEDDAGRRARMTPGNYSDIAELEGVFRSVAAFGAETTTLEIDGEPVALRGSRVTPDYFETLGVRLLTGRSFDAEEALPDGPPVVVLSHHVWQQMFGEDPEVLRRSIRLDGADARVVGVAPPGVYPTQATVSAELPFSASSQDFFVPLRYGSEGWSNRRSHVLGMIGRLAPETDHDRAAAALDVLSARLRADEPLNASERILATSFTGEVVGDVRFALYTLLGTVGLVLLIAIANVGALFVLRADDRQSELAIRAALGAPRSRLARQMLLESALVVGVAALASVVVARFALAAMQGLVPYQIPRLADVTVHGPALVVALAVALIVAAIFGLLPAARLRARRLAGPISRTRQTSGVRQRRLQRAVVAFQSALCVIVLVGAALLSRSYANLRSVDTGFSAKSAWTMSISADRATLQEVLSGIRAIPGVASAAFAYDHPLERNWGDGFTIEGVERSDTDPPTSGSLRPFDEGYFETAGIALLEGRVPDRVDFDGEVAYAVINETLARTFFPDGSAVGSRIVVPTAQRMLGTDGFFEIAGVVADVRFLGPDQPVSPAFYLPVSHFPVGATTLLVRPEPADAPVLPAIREAVRRVDPALGVDRAERLQDILDGLLARPRFNMMLLLVFGAIGLLLCGLGAYGLVGRVVAMRSREIGIQLALGAAQPRLAGMVLSSALRPVLLGGAVGTLVAIAMARLIETLLFGVSPADPASFVASSAFLLLVGALAALVPTMKAIAIDPASALRAE